jgi:polyhydroxybutyrate depolymerase
LRIPLALTTVVLCFVAGGACNGRPGVADAAPPANAPGAAAPGATPNPATTATTTTPVAATTPPSARPYDLHVPKGWDRTHPAPLVLFFHGYGGRGSTAAGQIQLGELSDAKGFVLAAPDGTPDNQGSRFWNATDACCDLQGRGIDDVAYASWILDDVASKLPIDPKRVYVMGHSNGGFMALRLACDLSTRIAAAVSLAGAAWKDDTKCRPREPVSVLQVHGDADAIVHYGGGLLFDLPGHGYPGALQTVSTFALKDRCTGSLTPTGAPFDFDVSAPGAADTTMADYAGCPKGISVSLWTVAGGSHFALPTPAGSSALWAWMAAHPKP